MILEDGNLKIDTVHQGDCLELMPFIKDKSIDLILCDLPYGSTACKWDQIIPFEPLWAQYKRLIKDHGAIVLTASQPFTSVLISSQLSLFKYCWIWQKSVIGNIFNCKNSPQKNYEDIAVFSKASIANCANQMMVYNPQGLIQTNTKRKNALSRESDTIGTRPSRKGNYVQEFTNDPRQILSFKNDTGLHPTQKPVALFEYLIKTYTNEGDLVLDNCIGSGTTAIAALNTRRHFIGIEKEPKYVEIARRRVAAVPARLDRWATGEGER